MALGGTRTTGWESLRQMDGSWPFAYFSAISLLVVCVYMHGML